MLPSPFFRSTPIRRRIVLLLAVAVLLAGIVQAVHTHKDELTGCDGDKHCLVCVFVACNGAPPALVVLVRPAALPVRAAICSFELPRPCSLAPASYNARGPPAV
jgi:hypothetical protein